MERNFLTTAYPETKLSTETSIGLSVLTNIQLLDYFLNSSTTPGNGIKNLSLNLEQSAKDDLRLLRTVFAHGVILREFYILNNKQLNQEWELFIRWWKELSEEEMIDLVSLGIREAMDYYYKYLPRMTAVEKVLANASLEKDELKNQDKRRTALKAVFESWSVDDIEETLSSYDDLTYIKEKIIGLLESVWHLGFRELWESERHSLTNWKTENKTLLSKSYRTNVEAVFEITGLYPDTSEMETINRAELLTFVPVPNMRRLLSFDNLNNHLYLMFDPKSTNDKNSKKLKVMKSSESYLAFEGLGDQSRLQIIELLAKKQEMFAQQIVNTLKMKQSTVSRHLNQLHQSGLINVRYEGNSKYFSLNKEEIKAVITILEAFVDS